MRISINYSTGVEEREFEPTGLIHFTEFFVAFPPTDLMCLAIKNRLDINKPEDLKKLLELSKNDK